MKGKEGQCLGVELQEKVESCAEQKERVVSWW